MPKPIARLIDHAVLHPTQTEADLVAACQLCAEVRVATVCVKPYAVARAVELLDGSPVLVSSVIGFPHGGNCSATKVTEARLACADGAAELDMVVNIGQVLAEEWPYVEEDIRGVVDEGRRQGATTKVIFETGLLSRDELKVRLCEISERAGAAFVKTSTGFGFVRQPDGSMRSTGATDADIVLMRKHCSESMGVKASGGIRSYADAVRLVELGATRLGTSATQAIVEGERGAETTAKTDY